MARLDSMTKEELSKLHFASETLLWIGAIKMVLQFYLGVIVFLFLTVITYLQNPSLVIIPIILGTFFSLFAYTSSVVFKEARSAAAQIYFKINSITSIITSVLGLIGTYIDTNITRQSNINAVIPQVIILVILLIAGILIYMASKQNNLFGENNFTSEQIKAANKKLKNNETFTDEELPAPYSDSKKVKVYLVIAFIGEFFITLGILIKVFSPNLK
jgi:hypothetical protein